MKPLPEPDDTPQNKRGGKKCVKSLIYHIHGKIFEGKNFYVKVENGYLLENSCGRCL